MAYTFLRWFRSGIAASLGPQPAAATARRAKLTVGVDVGTGLANQNANVALDVLGPGDVTGIDGRQVIRSFPVPNTLDFERAFFAHVEFDRPDLPWLFTPFGPTAGLLRPWIGLVVVERGENAEIRPTLPLPTLTVRGSEVGNLPTLAEAHAWAHVQIAGDIGTGPGAIASQEPERILSRLVCPRALDPDKAYLACVVPTFMVGALAGLGREVRATVPLDAWPSGNTTVELPVYHHWEFSTGGTGDFKSLVLRLEGRSELPGVGTRPLDVTAPGFGRPERSQTTTIPLGGVLRVEEAAPSPIDEVLAAELELLINTPGSVAPPIYGRWHAAITEVRSPAGPTAGWPEALNVDPRYRVAAGLGTHVVQERQEDLMAAVWEQVGEILRANQLLRQAQLAVAGSERVVARHVNPLSPAALVSLAGPALARIAIAPGHTARSAVAQSCLPLLALLGAFRKVVRARGPLERRLARALPDEPGPAVNQDSLLAQLASGALAPRPADLPAGAVPLPERPPFSDTDPEPGALEELEPTFATLASRAAPRACTPLDLGALAGTVRAALEPDIAVADRARAQIGLPESDRLQVSARLDPIMAAPEIPTPMIGPLRELGQDWLLPGLGEVPHNTLAIVEPDAGFVEAYMVGLNHEMGRELLWRGFPTDQRGTVFSRFWDRRGSVSTKTASVPDRDIVPIHEWRDRWGRATPLGTNVDHGSGKLVVLLIRGDLLQRYPRATIFLQRARWKRDSSNEIEFEDDLAVRQAVPLPDEAAWEADARFPLFLSRVGADITFLGFPLSREEVHGVERGTATRATRDDKAGWYAVFQEQPTEPRFGLGKNDALPPPADRRSDDLAKSLLRRAFRLLVHGSDLIEA